MNQRKLTLILDLDHTLVHGRSTKHAEGIESNDDALKNDHSNVYRIKTGRSQMDVAVRPGVTEFLRSLSKIFEMHVFTLGTREYAHKVVSLIDPDNTMIRDRIRSRCDSSSSVSKEQEIFEIFPTGDRIVAILDDRRDVWAGTDNIIQVLPFVFFDKTSPPSTLSKYFTQDTIDRILNYCGTNNYLERLSQRMHEMHTLFYDTHDTIASSRPLSYEFEQFVDDNMNADLRSIISHVRSNTLKTCKLLFTGVIKVDGDPSDSPEYLLATYMGAEVKGYLSSGVTHVITAGTLTKKTRQAARSGLPIAIVTTDWLYCCYYLGEHVPEDDFLYNVSESPWPESSGSESPVYTELKRKSDAIDECPTKIPALSLDELVGNETLGEFLKELEDELDCSDLPDLDKQSESEYIFIKTDTENISDSPTKDDSSDGSKGPDENTLKEFVKNLDSYFQ